MVDESERLHRLAGLGRNARAAALALGAEVRKAWASKGGRYRDDISFVLLLL